MAMMDNSSLHMRQPIGIFQSNDWMTFQVVRWNVLENRRNFTFEFLIVTYIDALQFCFEKSNK
jgi:hypothetical protein